MIDPNALRLRRHFLRTLTASAASLAAWRLFEPGAFASALDERILTPPQIEGPFFPDKLPLDTDNDLLILNDAITPAVGEVTHLTGRVLDRTGSPVRNATVEIWQVDNKGSYLHSRGANPRAPERDPNFQGYGRFLTDSTGAFYFRTIKPVPYPGRTPHIHARFTARGQRQLTTQLYIKDHPMNARDGILNAVGDPRARDTIISAFSPLPDSRAGELAAHYDVVLGISPEDRH